VFNFTNDFSTMWEIFNEKLHAYKAIRVKCAILGINFLPLVISTQTYCELVIWKLKHCLVMYYFEILITDRYSKHVQVRVRHILKKKHEITIWRPYETFCSPKIAVFWDVAACGSCKNLRFGGASRFHLQGRRKYAREKSVRRLLTDWTIVRKSTEWEHWGGGR
jgi:hypothetical protein